MPGESTLPVQHYPDDFFVYTCPVFGSSADTAVFYCDRPMVVDSCTVLVSFAASGATIQMRVVPEGTSPTTANIGNATAITDSQSIATTGVYQVPVVLTENVLPAGSLIAVDMTGTTTAFRGAVQLRLRSRMK